MQIQYVSIAFAWRGSALPRQRRRNFSAAVRPWATTSSGTTSVSPSATRAERATMAIICAEIRPRSVRACSSEISFSLPSPTRRRARCLGLEVGGAVPGEARGLVRVRLRHRRGEVVVDEQAPDVLVREVADEILDVDAAVPERASVPIWLGDLGLDSDNTLETRLELAHPTPCRRGRSAPRRYLSRRPAPCHYPAAHAARRHPRARRRNRARAHRGDATRARGDRCRLHVGRPAGRRRRDGVGRDAAPSRDARRDQRRRRAQRADHDARSARASAPSTSPCGTSSASTRACGRARRTGACGRATRTSTSS